MRLRSYIHAQDYKYIQKWVNSERIHALWCANLLPWPLTEVDLETFLEKDAKAWGSSAHIVMGDAEEPAGFFVYAKNPQENTGFLKFVILDSELRCRGHGTRMMELILKYAFDMTGAAEVRLNVFDTNGRARKCYLKAGFVESAIAENAFVYKNERWGRCCMTVSRETWLAGSRQ